MLELLGIFSMVLWIGVAIVALVIWNDYRRLRGRGRLPEQSLRRRDDGHHAWEREHDYLRVIFCGQVGIDEVVTDVSEGECPNCGELFIMEDLLNEGN